MTTTATRPYLYYDAVVSICTTCFRKIDRKIVFEDGHVWILKHRPTHGDPYKLFYRDDLEATRLAALREWAVR